MLCIPIITFILPKNSFIHSISTYSAYEVLDIVLSTMNKSKTCLLTSWSLKLENKEIEKRGLPWWHSG